MTQSVVVVDSFTDCPYAGNPAAVCVMSAPASEDWMRAVAREMNLSETAFLYPMSAESGASDEGGAWRLRWLTPLVEIDLCGHATLASAHVLYQTGAAPAEVPLRFQTRSGLLRAHRPEGRPGFIALDFPSRPVRACPTPAGLEAALGVRAVWVGSAHQDLLVELESASVVRKLQPDSAAVARIAPHGLIVTAPSDDPEAAFVSRFFAPAIGIPEDPVTGAAHCALAPFWADCFGRLDLVGHQVSARGGVVHVTVKGDRVELAGQAVTVSRGELLY